MFNCHVLLCVCYFNFSILSSFATMVWFTTNSIFLCLIFSLKKEIVDLGLSVLELCYFYCFNVVILPTALLNLNRFGYFWNSFRGQWTCFYLSQPFNFTVLPVTLFDKAIFSYP